ncbi:MAG: zinc ribbon domain-containing protein [Desulfosalsimonadaceae bacterium]
MPIYEFRCLKCGNVQEVIVTKSESDSVEMKCNACESSDLERVLSAASYTMGASASGPRPNVSTKTCGENTCGTLNIPGPTR